jgi:hypothetical protein
MQKNSTTDFSDNKRCYNNKLVCKTELTKSGTITAKEMKSNNGTRKLYVRKSCFTTINQKKLNQIPLK